MALELKADVREGNKKSASSLRKEGYLPGVLYGRRQKAMPIVVKQGEFDKVWKSAGESTAVALNVGADSFDCLIYEVDLDPIKNTPRHADFYVFEKGQKLKVRVPVEFVGVAPAIKDLGGVLVKVLHDIEIEAEPKNLPAKIDVDISKLAAFDSQVLARDVILPPSVTLVTGPEEVVASIYEPKEEKVEETPAPDLTAIEVEKKGKKEEEGGETALAPEPAAKPKTEKSEAAGKK